MATSFEKIVDLVSTIDDCLMLDENGACTIEVISKKDGKICLSRTLQCGDLYIIVGNDEQGSCGYIGRTSSHKNTASSTRAPQGGIAALEFNTNFPFADIVDDLKSKIRDIIKWDMRNARELVEASN
jgi:hypothetical protein